MHVHTHTHTNTHTLAHVHNQQCCLKLFCYFFLLLLFNVKTANHLFSFWLPQEDKQSFSLEPMNSGEITKLCAYKCVYKHGIQSACKYNLKSLWLGFPHRVTAISSESKSERAHIFNYLTVVLYHKILKFKLKKWAYPKNLHVVLLY